MYLGRSQITQKDIMSILWNHHLSLIFLGRYNSNDFKPLFCQSHQIGLVSRKIKQELIPFEDTFLINQSSIEVCPGLKNYFEITKKVDSVVSQLRERSVFIAKPEWVETMDVRPAKG